MLKLNSNFFSMLLHGKATAAGTVLLLALIAVTPLCGFMFSCGCAWPWLGLDEACNIRVVTARHHCPWCASQLGGWLSVGIALAAGVAASCLHMPAVLVNYLPVARIALGLSAFTATALAAGYVAAKLQHYLLGIFDG